jgi:ankyrin repeat protein
MKPFKTIALSFVFICLIFMGACKHEKRYNETLTKDLVAAATNWNVDSTRSLLARNANPNALDNDSTPLLMSVLMNMQISFEEASSGTITGDQRSSETTEIVKLLLEAGANPNAMDKDGKLVLRAAFTRGDENIVSELIRAGASVNRTDSSVNSLIVNAAFCGNPKIIQLMLDAGADVNGPGKDGTTALLVSTYKNYPEISSLLIQKGANVNARLDVGTPLLFAAAEGDIEIVKLLVEKGADVNAKDDKNNSPLSIAEERKYQQVVDFLKASGAK